MKDSDFNRFWEEGGNLKFISERSSVNEYKKQGYRKMNHEEATAASAVFSHIPEGIVHQVYDSAYRKSFDDAVQGSLIAKLKPGTYMPMSKTTPGALSNVGLSIDNNQAGHGNPVFFKNDAILSTPAGPRIALGIFNLVSFAVGQYNMVQIAGTLQMLRTGVDQILDFLKDEQRARLKAVIQIYENACCEMKYAMGNEQRLNGLRTQILLTVLPVALELMNFSSTQMDKLMMRLKKDDSIETIQNNFKDINDSFYQYKVAILLCEKARQLLYSLSQTGDPKEIKDVYLNPLEELFDEYCSNTSRWLGKVMTYIHSCNAFNGRSTMRNIVSTVSGGLVALLSTNAGIKAYTLVDDLFAASQKEKKTAQQIEVSPTIKAMMEIEIIEAPVKSVRESLQIIKDGIKIVRIGNEYYTNLPESKAS